MVTTIIATIVILLAVGCAIRYIIKEKKKGVKCIGCPAAGSCQKHHDEQSGHSCGCH